MNKNDYNQRLININVIDVITLLKKDKRNILIYAGIAAFLGLVIAFTTPKTYKSTVMLAPEESGSGFSGSLSSLASMVGMNMKIGQTGDALYPEIYPDLVSSTDFIVGLFPIKVTTKEGNLTYDYFTYLTKHQKIALTSWPIVVLGQALATFKKEEQLPHGKTKTDPDPFWLTRKESEVVKGISGNIKCDVDKKTSVITISVTDQDPLVAALMADSVKTHLQVAITDYKTKKARIDLEYMEKLYAEARAQYVQARQHYGSAADADMDVTLQSYKLKTEDLENDMQLKYNIYQQVVEQLQLARAKVQERTPAFTVIQSASVPVRPSSRSRLSTLIIWIFMGLALRTFIIGWKNRKMFIEA